MTQPRILLIVLTCLLLTPRTDARQASEPGPKLEDSQERTVVSARKIEEDASDVPISVQVIDGETIDRANLEGIRDAGLLVPNVNITEFSSRRLSFPFIRGIGSGQGEPSVVTYIDGVPQLTTGSTNLPLLGVERIEFLRGPQGTLYGRNSLGGLIHVLTEAPSFQPESTVGISAGEYGFRQVRASTSGPLEPGRSAFRISGQWAARDGYVINDVTGHSVADREAWFGRADLLYLPDDHSQLRFSLYGERARDGGFALGFLNDPDGAGPTTGLRTNPYNIQIDYEGFIDRNIASPSVVYEHEGEVWNTTSVTALEAWDVTEESDFDFSPLDAVRRRSREDQQYLYQELRWASPRDESQGADWDWVFGFSGFASVSDRSATNDIRDDAVFIGFDAGSLGKDTRKGDFEDYGLAAFGNLTFADGEPIEFDVGVRVDYEAKDATLDHTFEGFTVAPTQDLDESYSQVVPRASVTWNISEDAIAYVSAATGFKAGGFNLSAPTTDQFAFEPEESVTYELGTKQSFADDRFELGASLFYIDWEEMQLSLFDPVAGGYVDNGGESRSRGVEIEARSQLVAEGLDLIGGWALADTEFDRGVVINGTDVSGNDLILAPEETWNLGLQYALEVRRDVVGFIRADWTDVGTFFYDPENLESESYDLLNLQVGFQSEDLFASLWVRNALDKEYVPVAFNAGSASSPSFIGESGAPQAFGMTLRLSF